MVIKKEKIYYKLYNFVKRNIESKNLAMKELIEQLDIIDKSLFVVLFISLLCKFLKELGLFIFKCKLIKKKDFNKKCVFLEENGGKYECRVDYLREKFFVNRCNKIHCWGYKTSEINVNDFINNRLVFRTIDLCVNVAAELSSAILIIKNIL